MTIEEKKVFLRRYGEIDDRIEQLRRAKESSRLCEKYQNSDFNDEIKGSKNKGSIVEVTVEKRQEDWDMLIQKELSNLYALRVLIEGAINSLQNFTEQRLLRLLYLGEIDEYGDRSRFSFSKIAEMMNYSERQIYRIYKNALVNLPEMRYVSECQ